MQREVEDLHAAMDSEGKSKGNVEKIAKTYELQVAELQSKCDEQSRQLADMTSVKGRLHSENADIMKQLEDAESNINAVQRVKAQLQSQLEETKRALDEESRVRNHFTPVSAEFVCGGERSVRLFALIFFRNVKVCRLR